VKLTLALLFNFLCAPATAISSASRTLSQDILPTVAEQPAADTSGTGFSHLFNSSAPGTALFNYLANVTRHGRNNQSQDPLLARAERPLLPQLPQTSAKGTDEPRHNSSSSVRCPAESASISAAGCPCTMHPPIKRRHASSSWSSVHSARKTTAHNICPAGWVIYYLAAACQLCSAPQCPVAVDSLLISGQQ